MYSFLVVDDMRDARDRVKELLEKCMEPPVLIELACNGEEAMEKCSKCNFDIIITDICMNALNGLDFIARMRANSSGAVFIVISGYDCFSFAQKSIEYGVSMYLLKPIDEKEFVKAVHSAVKAVDSREDTNSAMIEYKKFLTGMMTQGFKDIFQGNDTDIAELRIMGRFIARYFAVICINPRMGADYLTGDQELRSRLRSVVNSHASHIWLRTFCITNSDGCLVLVVNDPVPVDESSTKDLYKALLSSPEMSDLTSMSLGVSENAGSLEALKDAYRHALEADRQQMLARERVIFYESMCKNASSKKSSLPFAAFQHLREALETDDKRAVDTTITEIFNGVTSYEELSRLLNGLFSYLSVNFFEQYPNVWGEDTPQDVLRAGTDGADSLEKLFLVLKMNCYKLCDIFTQNKLSESMNVHKAQMALNYIDNNICRELTMAEVANFVDLSYSHFSRIFKNIVGMNFIDYLTCTKVNRAKQMLTGSDMSIKQISVALGYKKSRYFSDIFKKSTGLLPSEYRGSAGISHKEQKEE